MSTMAFAQANTQTSPNRGGTPGFNPNSSQGATTTPRTSQGSESPNSQGVSSPASELVEMNNAEVAVGKIAASKAQNAEVKSFADMMVTGHTAVNKQAVDLVTKLKVTPQDNPTSQALKAGGDKNLETLKKLSGPAFDKAYIDHEVAYHQQVLDAVDKTLIPSAKNDELKALLVKVRPAFVAHLEHAKMVQSSLAK
jgi:putative membrane protein